MKYVCVKDGVRGRGLSWMVLRPFQVFAEGDEEEDDSSVADEPPAPVVKLRGKKVCITPW